MRRNKIVSGLKIITVEDSPLVAERLKFMLSDIANTEFLGNARSASEALHLISEKNPNIVILDIHLGDETPNANGIHLLITLRRKYSKMKIIMLTNHTASQYRNICLALGADYFFDKSNDFERVPEVLKKIQS